MDDQPDFESHPTPLLEATPPLPRSGFRDQEPAGHHGRGRALQRHAMTSLRIQGETSCESSSGRPASRPRRDNRRYIDTGPLFELGSPSYAACEYPRPSAPLSPGELPKPRPAGVPTHPIKQFFGRDAERASEFDHRVEAGDPFAPLELADRRAMQRGAH